MKNSMLMFIFFCLDQKYPIFTELFPKRQNCWSWNLELRLIWIWRIGCCLFVCLFFVLFLFVCLFVFHCLDWKRLFWVDLVQKFETVKAKIWSLIYIEYVKFDGDVLFFCFRLFPFSILMLTDQSPISLLAKTNGFYCFK